MSSIRIVAVIVSLLSITSAFAAKPISLEQKENRFIQHMVTRYHFNRERLTQLLKQTPYNETVIKRMNSPFEKKPWDYYRQFFLKPDRIENGVAYWQTHQDMLARAQAKFGVPASIIVAIIGMESMYGTHKGKYPTLSTLKTLAFNYPKRSKFFRKELEQYLLLTRKNKLEPRDIRGSYAGALGIPQFMPSSYRHYGYSFHQAAPVNLIEKHEDAIASIGNYLKHAGWQRQQPIATPATLALETPDKVVNKRKLRYTVAQLEKMGVKPRGEVDLNRRATLIELQNQKGREYWLSYQNFAAIMRYNTSPVYAMAVYQLSQAIKQAYEKQTRTRTRT